MGVFRYTRWTFVREAALLLAGLFYCVPAYILITLSLKTTAQSYSAPLKFPTDPKFGNYATAWKHGGQVGLGWALWSTIVITTLSVIGLVLIGSLCAYAIARRQSRLSTALYVLFVLAIILPPQLGIIPIFVEMRNLNLTGTYWGMILLNIGIHLPLVIFIYAGFIRALAKDYEEAAYVDGAGLVRIWLRVVFPLLIPVTATVAFLTGLVIWNDFFNSLIFLFGTTKETLPLALYSFVGENVSQWNLIMAAVAISIAPVLVFFMIAQKHLVRGFAGGIKGG